MTKCFCSFINPEMINTSFWLFFYNLFIYSFYSLSNFFFSFHGNLFSNYFCLTFFTLFLKHFLFSRHFLPSVFNPLLYLILFLLSFCQSFSCYLFFSLFHPFTQSSTYKSISAWLTHTHTRVRAESQTHTHTHTGIYKRFMVLTSSLGELMKDQMLQYY